MEFPKLVKYIRKELGLSQEQLARALNISFSTVNRWENSKAKPSQMAKELLFYYCEQKGIDINNNQQEGNSHDKY